MQLYGYTLTLHFSTQGDGILILSQLTTSLITDIITLWLLLNGQF